MTTPPTSDQKERLAERPDDSGTFDDETLESIIRESIDHITDPVTRRDMRWLIARLDARVPAEQRVERTDYPADVWCSGWHDHDSCLEYEGKSGRCEMTDEEAKRVGQEAHDAWCDCETRTYPPIAAEEEKAE